MTRKNDTALAGRYARIADQIAELYLKTDDPLAMYMSDIMTLPTNIAGIPGVAVPCGFVDGLPVGLQFMAPTLGEPVLLRAAYAYEQRAGTAGRQPVAFG